MYRTSERSIVDAEVEEVVKTGAVIHTNQRGVHGGLKRLYKKFVAGRVVVVVAEIRQKDCWVITTYAEED
jgi:hypothetical protein